MNSSSSGRGLADFGFVHQRPNVACLLDAGDDDGQSWFAMGYVPGQPLSDDYREHRLSLEQRLRLFAQVCDGVQQAHMKGILHRDLNPGNTRAIPMTEQTSPSTRVDQIADGIHRISTAIPPALVPGGFTFNQFLIDDDEPLLFHTGPRKLFPLIRDAIATVMPVARLRHIAFSHFEADECGALNEFLAAAPGASPLCSRIGAMTSVADIADREPRAIGDGEQISLGRHTLRWLDTPHMPHGWDCGFLFEATTRTLLCGDLFTQGGDQHLPVTEQDILAPSLAAHEVFDYYANSRDAEKQFAKLIATKPQLLACMHGSSWRGDGADLLRALANALA
ncbi:MAG: glyoxylase-like metal-dependent hydrolase (beta-lactamase superfamily II) [Planctomycetota bacterium]